MKSEEELLARLVDTKYERMQSLAFREIATRILDEPLRVDLSRTSAAGH